MGGSCTGGGVGGGGTDEGVGGGGTGMEYPMVEGVRR